MRIEHGGFTYELTPSGECWHLSTVKVSKKHGTEYLSDTRYPGSFPRALQSLLDRMMRDGLSPTADFTEAVATVAHLYRVIGQATSEDNE